MSEATHQVPVPREGITHRPAAHRARILTGVQEVILFLHEAIIPQVHLIAIPHQGAADLLHLTAVVLPQVVLTLQDPPQALHQGLHQVVADLPQAVEALLQDSDS